VEQLFGINLENLPTLSLTHCFVLERIKTEEKNMTATRTIAKAGTSTGLGAELVASGARGIEAKLSMTPTSITNNPISRVTEATTTLEITRPPETDGYLQLKVGVGNAGLGQPFHDFDLFETWTAPVQRGQTGAVIAQALRDAPTDVGQRFRRLPPRNAQLTIVDTWNQFRGTAQLHQWVQFGDQGTMGWPNLPGAKP
jgi:hypothetical protein